MNNHKVNFTYFIPSDKQNVAEQAITNVALHLQCWYRWQMGNNKTFTLTNPVVAVYHTAHDSMWYSTNNSGGANSGWFWNNCLHELFLMAGGGFYQEYNDWVMYIDAEPGPGQYAGGTSGGYISGVCVLGSKDIASVMGIDPDWTQCRGIGGCGHEFGHSLGLPHPPAGPDFGRAIMGTGYMSYPNAVLLDANKSWLNTNPFFEVYPPLQKPPICPFNDHRPTPVPRPRPTPRPHTIRGFGRIEFPRT